MQERHPRTLPKSSFPLSLDLFLKSPTVGEAGEGVGECQSKELLFEHLSVGNVGPDRDVLVRLTLEHRRIGTIVVYTQ
jgi:hypothetical protein